MMGALLRHRPSPAFVVALVALFVAVSGTTYAAINLPANSVGTKQLKKNAVTRSKIAARAVNGSKVAKDSLTGANILESSLRMVPSAANARSSAHATTADSATNAAHATSADTAQPTGPAGGDLTGNYPNPTIAGGAVTASKLGMLPTVSVTALSQQNVPSFSNTTLTFDYENFDTDNMHSTSVNPSRLTAQTGGTYLITAQIEWLPNATGYREIQLCKNASVCYGFNTVPAVSGNSTFQNVQQVWRMSPGEYVVVLGWQTSGSTLGIGWGQDIAFTMTWLAP